MKSFSVKAKILFTIITLSVTSLGVFGYLSFTTYKKDKLAFVYDYLASETQSKSMLFSSTVESYDLFLGSIISRIDFKTRHLPEGTLKYLEKNQRVLGLYYHIPDQADFGHITLLESSSAHHAWDWKNFENAPIGLSLIDAKQGDFLLKKTLTSPGAFAAVVFRQPEISDLLKSSSDRFHFILSAQGTMTKEMLPFKPPTLAFIYDKIHEAKASFGLIETMVEDERYFISFSKLSFQNLMVVSMIKEKKVLLIQDIFLNQVIIFLVLMVSVSLLVGTLSARWLTLHLDELTHAAKEMEAENFDVTVNIDSKDELGTLGLAFNSMSGRIKFLLEELRRYNTELEMMVAARTKELQELTNIQKAMLNSLGQGFVIINKDHRILPVYSKLAEEMFEVIPNQASPSQILGITPGEEGTYREFFDLVFSQAIEFDDMTKLNPDFRSNSKNQKIALNYAPIKDGEEGSLEYVMVIGTDKTAELESMEKFKKEWNFSQMILKMASNRFSLNKIIHESLGMISSSLVALEENHLFAVRDIQRNVHTMKGSFSYFYIDEVTKLAHDFETYLGAYYNEEHLPDDVKALVFDKIMALQIAIECYTEKYDSILQYKDSSTTKLIELKDLQHFYGLLGKKSASWAQLFSEHFFKTKVSPFFQIYPSLVDDLGIKLNKKVRFILEGADTELPDGHWDELFGQCIHVIRNAMDHGIESPTERMAMGKSDTGEIHFRFEKVLHDGERFLKFTLSDDGKGVDWKKLAEKDPTITSEDEALTRIMKGGLSSKDEVSDISGRGVGVSSFFATVEKWGGQVEIKNSVGLGMSIIVHVPLETSIEKHKLRTA